MYVTPTKRLCRNVFAGVTTETISDGGLAMTNEECDTVSKAGVR
jgi:hypothetical protein